MKDINDYLHLYLGCECQFGYIDRIGRLSGIDERYGWQIFYPGNPIVPYRFVRPELIKLLLRPLSDMTREELLERGNYLLEINHGANIEAEYFRWMVSHGFDVFGLISAGLAIDKTKLSNQ